MSDIDPDAAQVRRAAWRVGIFLALTTSALVSVVLVTMVWVVLADMRSPATSDPHGVIDVSGPDLLKATVVIGALAIVVATITSAYATTKATAPLASALRLQRQFVADASHELRTPIAVLDMRLQLLQRRPPAAGQVPAAIDSLRREVSTLADIVTDLLQAAELEPRRAGDRADVPAVISSAIESLGVLARSRKVVIDVVRLDPSRAIIPPAALRRAVYALVDNAIKHAPAGSAVRVSCVGLSNTVSISVLDVGRGIQGIAPERIFDRFSRGSQEDPRAGRGIGLSLVRDTARRYGGDVILMDHAGPGAAFLLTLPGGAVGHRTGGSDESSQRAGG